MRQQRRRQSSQGVFAAAVVFSGLAGWLLLGMGATPPGVRASISMSDARVAGEARLVSIQPLPQMQGAICEWAPASSTTRTAALQGETTTGQSAAGASGGETAKRSPLRVIKDSYPTYSAVAVDVANNEVVLQDENLFQILVYDRMANTPPTASWTEPKRVIGGHHTKLEFNCALYVDPQSGDIYSVNNDTVDTMVIFDRNAKGDVPPTRELSTPHGTFGIAVDEGQQELFLTVQHSSSVVVYAKSATGREAPLRHIQGNRTRLADPHGIALDTRNGLMFVANYGSKRELEILPPRPGQSPAAPGAGIPRGRAKPGTGKIGTSSITVYPIDARGDVAPLRVIAGPKTQLNWPAGMTLDEERGELYVANDAGDSVLVFRTDATGDVAPIRVLKGPRTGIKNPTSISLDKKNNELWVANFGNHTATVFSRTANGDVPPLRTIRSGPLGQPALMIGNPGSVAYDTKREEILVPN